MDQKQAWGQLQCQECNNGLVRTAEGWIVCPDCDIVITEDSTVLHELICNWIVFSELARQQEQVRPDLEQICRNLNKMGVATHSQHSPPREWPLHP